MSAPNGWGDPSKPTWPFGLIRTVLIVAVVLFLLLAFGNALGGVR